MRCDNSRKHAIKPVTEVYKASFTAPYRFPKWRRGVVNALLPTANRRFGWRYGHNPPVSLLLSNQRMLVAFLLCTVTAILCSAYYVLHVLMRCGSSHKHVSKPLVTGVDGASYTFACDVLDAFCNGQIMNSGSDDIISTHSYARQYHSIHFFEP